ncbi:MAG TPA: ATP-binding protein [Solirubrobacteraceae bacterium]|nr:ATP-binding protein [Solirubrobacteraceae bacterium]
MTQGSRPGSSQRSPAHSPPDPADPPESGTPPAAADPPASVDALDRMRRRLRRERDARRQAEVIAESTTRELYDRQRELTLVEAVATASNSATSVEDALRIALELVCAHADFAVGHAYLRDGDGGRLRSAGVWHVPPQLEPFRGATSDRTFGPGEGLPGRVLVSGRPEWIEDVAHQTGFTRRHPAVELGLRSALAFPLLIGAETVGVLEFMTTRFASADPSLLTLMAQVGTQLGRVIERFNAHLGLEQLARELAASNDELRRSNEELEVFASVASHDLSEPLRTVAGFIELLHARYADQLDDQARNFIEYSLSDIGRMRAMIADVLEYSRVGSSAAEHQPTDTGEVVARALGALAPRIAETQAEISLGDLPTVHAHPNELVRVFQNLIGNALKFVPTERSPRIRVTADSPDPGEWRFSVIDNGTGIPPDERDRIFTMFHRADRSGARSGSGIGLSICAKIVVAHGGRIWVEDAPAGGSAFRFTLPERPAAGDGRRPARTELDPTFERS